MGALNQLDANSSDGVHSVLCPIIRRWLGLNLIDGLLDRYHRSLGMLLLDWLICANVAAPLLSISMPQTPLPLQPHL